MPLGDFLALLEHSADTFQGREDFYLAQCPFLLPRGSKDSPAPALAPLANALTPPPCLKLAPPTPESEDRGSTVPVPLASSSSSSSSAETLSGAETSATVETASGSNVASGGSLSAVGVNSMEIAAFGDASAARAKAFIASSEAPEANPASMCVDDVTGAEVTPAAAETPADPVLPTNLHGTETEVSQPTDTSLESSALSILPDVSATSMSAAAASSSVVASATAEETSISAEAPTHGQSLSDSLELRVTDGSEGAYPSDLEGNLWACHRAASTSTHFDSRHNLLVVLKGNKRVTLWSPAESKRLVPGCNGHAAAAAAGVAEVVTQSFANNDLNGSAVASNGNTSSSMSSNNSNSNTANGSKSMPEQVGWPTHALLGKGDGAGVVVEVQAGDALFIPEGWWHQVRWQCVLRAISGIVFCDVILLSCVFRGVCGGGI